jgi:hypothetical protein
MRDADRPVRQNREINAVFGKSLRILRHADLLHRRLRADLTIVRAESLATFTAKLGAALNLPGPLPVIFDRGSGL